MYPMGSWYLGSVPKDQWDNIGVVPVADRRRIASSCRSRSVARWPSTRKTKDLKDATAFAQAWSLDPANLKALIEGDGAFPMLKGKTLADYNVTVSPVFTDSFAYVTRPNNKVSVDRLGDQRRRAARLAEQRLLRGRARRCSTRATCRAR